MLKREVLKPLFFLLIKGKTLFKAFKKEGSTLNAI